MTNSPAAQSLQPDQLRHWHENGFLVLRRHFSPSQVQTLNQRLDEIWDERHELASAVTIDAWLEQERGRRLLFREAPDEAREAPYKLNDLYLEESIIRQAILEPSLCAVLADLIDGEPLVCNSLNFEYGSQQAAHFDTLYMPPRRQNKLVVSWIALDEVDDSNGAVTYFPGSHRIPPYFFSTGKLNAVGPEMPDFYSHTRRELEKRGIKEQPFHAQPGDVLIWHAQLLHGGSPIADKAKKRRSLVTHYFRRQDYRHQFWRLKKLHDQGYYINRRHPPVNK